MSSGWCGRICSWRCRGFGGRHHSGNGGGIRISESCDRILPPAPVHRPAGSTGLAEREIDPLRAQQRMLAVLERQYTVMAQRSEEHTSELQSLMRISYAVFCLKKKK